MNPKIFLFVEVEMTAQVNIQANLKPDEAFFTGPGTVAGDYLRSFWQPINVSNNIKPGRAKSVRIMDKDYTLYRGEGGDPHLLDNRCGHRGTQLSVGQIEGDSIRCLYHGWKYDQNGQCTQQPGEPRPFCDKISIRSYPVRDYLGLIFAYLGEGDPPPFLEFKEFEAQAHRVRAGVEAAPFNYYQRMENSHDFVHLAFVHKQCYDYEGERTLDNVIPRVKSEECSWGLRTHRIDPNGMELIAYFGMPNINYIFIGGGISREYEGEGCMLFWRVPVDDYNHLQFVLMWSGGFTETVMGDDHANEADLVNEKRNAMARAVLDSNLTIDDVIASCPVRENAFIFGVEDDVAMIGQGLIWDRKNEHLGASDMAIALIRRLWARDLRAIKSGEKRRDWVRTPDMVPELAALPYNMRN